MGLRTRPAEKPSAVRWVLAVVIKFLQIRFITGCLNTKANLARQARADD